MNSKDWISQAPLQSPALADVNASLSSMHPPLPSPVPLERHRGVFAAHPSFAHSPVQHQHPSSPVSHHYLPVKDESGRLPGMLTLASQPNTPRPAMNASPHVQPRKIPHPYATSSFHASPYARAGVPRKRGRTESLFPGDIGPLFTTTKSAENLCTIDHKLLDVHIDAKMDRGFFLADSDWTCYRRNYFQISTAFTVSGTDHYEQHPQYHVNVNGILHPVLQFHINISSRVSNGDKKIELVQHTPKRDKGPQFTPDAKVISPGGNLRMTTMGTNQTIVTFERIQFKTATANNGKRRAAQQYYVCMVDLYATIEGDQRVKIATCQSAPLVVRGRSPGHYSDHQGRYDANMPVMSPGDVPSVSSSQHHDDEYTRTSLPTASSTILSAGGAVGSDYGSPYQYHPPAATGYPNFPPPPPFGVMSNVSHPSTPTGPPPSVPSSYQHQQQHQHQQHMPYMVSSMSDPSSSESSSPDIYAGEYAAAAAVTANNVPLHGNSKMPPQLSHPGLHMPLESWPQSRSRFRQSSHASSDGSSAIYEQQYATYVPSSHPQGTSPTSYTPTPAFARQYEGSVGQQ